MSETGDKQPFAVNVELSDRRSAVEPRKGYFAALNNFFQSSVGAAALTLISTTLLGGFIGYVFYGHGAPKGPIIPRRWTKPTPTRPTKRSRTPRTARPWSARRRS